MAVERSSIDLIGDSALPKPVARREAEAEGRSTESAAAGNPVSAGANSTSETPKKPRKSKNQLKAAWTKQFYFLHWTSSAICLAAMLLFAVTGITLNHAGDIPSRPSLENRQVTVPPELRANLAFVEGEAAAAALPKAVAEWLGKELKVPLKGRKAEWTEEEIALDLPRPGGDAWLLLDRETGEVEYERTDRGAIAYLNDLHKGRHTGPVWAGFIDVFSVACVVFCLTGLGLLWVHAKRRPKTWPLVILGVVLPVVLLLFFVH